MHRKSFLSGFLFLLTAFSFTAAQNSEGKLSFSHVRGFYNAPFELTISSPIAGAKIRYTLNGTNPFTSLLAKESSSPARVTIDPTITDIRDQAPGFVITACAVLNDTLASKIVTQTYLFPNWILLLSVNNLVPGKGWLVPGTIAQEISYGLDPRIYKDPAYEAQIGKAFTSIPTLSLVTDLKNLFDTDSGIFVNASMHGQEWERAASLEFLNADSSNGGGFQINCGLRIRGGWSRHEDNPKHAFRVFFREQYGKSKLSYPLFGDEGAKEFDLFDIQTSQNYSWSYYGDASNTFLRELFSRDTQRDMNHPYTRGRFCHLYINGTYFGLFQIQERAEASYGASYFGGSKEDYDVIKPNITDSFENTGIEATDGTLDKWRELWQAGQTGFSSDALYFKVQGLNSDGSVNPAYSKLLDVDNLIDYMLIIFFTGNFDSPISAFGNNQGPNNFFAVYNRVNPDGFKFFQHDAEHSLFHHTWGLDRTGPFPAGSVFEKSNPQWIHQKLCNNPNYRLRFADRVYKHLFNGGALTLQKNTDRINLRKAEIETAIIAESARWGDSKTSEPKTKADWINAINFIVKDFLPGRANVVLGQLINKGLFVNTPPPDFNLLGGIVEKGFKVNMSTSSGKIYFTTDGTDPYSPYSGGISASATLYSGAIAVNKTTTVKARTLTNLNWSPLSEAAFIVKEDVSGLRVTELHYHPLDQDTTSDKYYEFIELKNCGGTELQLKGASFVSGIDYTFGDKTLAPGEFVVLASNKDEFNRRYGIMPYDIYAGQLDNSGEKIAFTSAAGDTLFSFTYNDKLPWPEEADGMGYSLAAKAPDASGNPGDASYWVKSAAVHGSPGKNDPATSVEEGSGSGVIKSFKIYQNYPNPFNPSTVISYELPSAVHVELKVYDILGQVVKELVDEQQSKGTYKVSFAAEELSSGIYFYTIKAGSFTSTQKMVLIR